MECAQSKLLLLEHAGTAAAGTRGLKTAARLGG